MSGESEQRLSLCSCQSRSTSLWCSTEGQMLRWLKLADYLASHKIATSAFIIAPSTSTPRARGHAPQTLLEYCPGPKSATTGHYSGKPFSLSPKTEPFV